MRDGSLEKGCAVAILAALAAGAAPAQDRARGPAGDFAAARVITDVTACRAINDAADRLACFDRATAALATAQERKDIVVVDRADVKKAKRGLFGFALPNINLFGKDDDEAAPEIKEVTAKIVRTAIAGQGLFALTLDDGTVWRMGESLGRFPPDPGEQVRIIRGSLGSFRASISGGRFVEVYRVR